MAAARPFRNRPLSPVLYDLSGDRYQHRLAHTEAEAETFAAEVVEVTEQVAESEKAQPEAEVVAQPEPVVEETPEPVAIEREELPLPELSGGQGHCLRQGYFTSVGMEKSL